MFTGCNVESASYGLTVCAERTAVFKAVSEGVKRFVRIAVYTPTVKPSVPCGACRQVLAEFAPDLEVVLGCDGAGCGAGGWWLSRSPSGCSGGSEGSGVGSAGPAGRDQVDPAGDAWGR